MKTSSRVLRNVFMVALLLILLSSFAYAAPVTDMFTGGLLQINNFFESRAYEPYSKAIDFFFFALLFIAVYMMGARYAFKEIKRPEQVIVILLGLMTAFLLVLGGFSATILLPYIHWLLYLLLFILYWHLLKGIKNPFWRFVLALLLTLLTIGLIQGLYNYLKAPEISGISASSAPSVGIGGFFKDLFGSFRGISLPGVSAPGVPDWAKNLYGAPTVAPTGPTTLPPAVTPTTPPPEEEGFSKWWLLLLLLLIFLLPKPRAWVRSGWERVRRRRPPTQPEALTIQRIPELINQSIMNKENKLREIKSAWQEKINLVKELHRAVDRRDAFLRKFHEDLPMLYTDEGREQLAPEYNDIKQFYESELNLIRKLKELKDIEKNLSNEATLNGWKAAAQAQGIANFSPEVDRLKTLITDVSAAQTLRNKSYREVLNNLGNIGIILLIKITYDFEEREGVLSQELTQLLQEENISQLVEGKYNKLRAEEKKLYFYVGMEYKLIKALGEKIAIQIQILERLRRLIVPEQPQPGEAPQQQPPPPAVAAPMPPTVVPARPTPPLEEVKPEIKLEITDYNTTNMTIVVHDSQNKYEEYLLYASIKKKGEKRPYGKLGGRVPPNEGINLPLSKIINEIIINNKIGIYDVIIRAVPLRNGHGIKGQKYYANITLPVGVIKIIQPPREPEPILYIGQSILGLKVTTDIYTQHYTYKWILSQLGKPSALLHSHWYGEYSDKAIPDYFDVGNARLTVNVYDERGKKIAEDSIEVLLEKGGTLVRRRVYEETKPPVRASPPPEQPPVTPPAPDIHQALDADVSSLGAEALGDRERSELLDDIFGGRKRQRKRRNE